MSAAEAAISQHKQQQPWLLDQPYQTYRVYPKTKLEINEEYLALLLYTLTIARYEHMAIIPI